jgi:hypothetical protein
MATDVRFRVNRGTLRLNSRSSSFATVQNRLASVESNYNARKIFFQTVIIVDVRVEALAELVSAEIRAVK